MIVTTSNKTQLQMVRGTSQLIEIRVTGPDGAPYTLLEGDVIRFGVKYHEERPDYLLKKESTELTGGVTRIALEPEDTGELECGVYKFDIGLQTGEQYLSVVPYSDFVLLPNITGKE